MPKNYSQTRAMMAVTRASLTATFKSPQSIFFSLFFPIVLLMIFGSLGGNRGATVPVAFEKNADTANLVYPVLRGLPGLRIVDNTKKDIEDELRKGRLTAILNITRNPAGEGYVVRMRTSSASQREMPMLQSVLTRLIHEFDQRIYPDRKSYITTSQTMVEGRKYSMIDFLLPGMIGFSLIGTAVFGVSFSFYSLRDTLVLKRMYSTPVKRGYIILGESISKVVFQLMTVVVLILFGYFVYDFFLAHGFITVINMLFLSFFALLVFMGFGFFISGISKNQNVIPVYANLFMFPQYFLSGTFFPKEALPGSLQSIISFLPLTALNDAMRNIAFEGASLGDCWQQLAILAAWGVVIYAITIKVFRWE
jgi:ABC-2 type transport system permease protein